MKLRVLILSLGFLFNLVSFGQDTLEIHFLYGSKPKAEGEPKWFGGYLGGHVGLGTDSNQILNFLPHNGFHYFGSKKNKLSHFVSSTYKQFYEILEGDYRDNKKAIVYIPVTKEQSLKFDSIQQVYQKDTPYDYAFVGMRCGSSSYDILAQLGFLPIWKRGKMVRRIFYPRRLRKRVIRLANEHNWKIRREEGTDKRKWEKD